MAPNKSFRTYGKRNTASVSCVEAFDILFAKNLTQRKLHGNVPTGRNKLKYKIEELPKKIKTVLDDESSLRVNLGDSFYNLLKGPCKNIVSNMVSNDVTSISTNIIGKTNRKRMNGSKRSLRETQQDFCKNTNLITSELDSWFNQPTPSGEKMSNVFEVEKAQPKWKRVSGATEYLAESSTSKYNRSNENFSSVVLSSQHAIHNPIFTNSVTEKILIHSSTPVAESRRHHLIKQPISPINNQDEVKKHIVESLEEIRGWNSSMPNFETLGTKVDNKSLDSLSNSKEGSSFILQDFDFFFEELRTKSLTSENFERSGDNFMEKPITVDDFEQFHEKLTTSQRKVMKSICARDFENFSKKFYKTCQKTGNYSKDFFLESFYKPDFVTHRKQKLMLNSNFIRENELRKQYNLKDLMVLLDDNAVQYSDLRLRRQDPDVFLNNINEKQLIIKLTRLSSDIVESDLAPLRYRVKPRLKVKKQHGFEKFKACRKFSSEWREHISVRRISLQSNISIRDSNWNSGVKCADSKTDGDISKTEGKLLSDFCKNGSKSEQKRNSHRNISNIPQINTSQSTIYHTASGLRTAPEIGKLYSVNIENTNEMSTHTKQVFPDLDSRGTTSDVEKQYIAKILSRTTESSNEEGQKCVSRNSRYSLLSSRPVSQHYGRLRLVGRHYSPNDLKTSSQRFDPCTNHHGSESFFHSDAKHTYIAQDLSDSILVKSYAIASDCHNSKPQKTVTNLISISNTTISSKNICGHNIIVNSDIFRNSEPKNEFSHSNTTEECDEFEELNLEVVNGSNQKLPNLKPGKSWRRSFMQNKRKTLSDCIRNSRLGSLAIGSVDDVMIQSSRELIPEKSPPTLTAQDMVLNYCKQTEPRSFHEMYPRSLLEHCKKIGEGVFGEVFLYSNFDEKSTIMKVIPIEGDQLVNGERQKKFHEILSEVAIALQLHNLRNNATNYTTSFCEVQRVSCVKGKYPKILLDLWYAYDKAKGSENDPPNIFDKDQLYVVLELGNAGQDLESFVFINSCQAVSVFKQVAHALAVGEEQLQFEHRDLHWGNVLVRTVEKNKKVMFKRKGKIRECCTYGVEATIIDYTLSRIAYDGVIIYNDLEQDPDLFLSEGDYQFDIYKLMKKKNNNEWKMFTPYTNVLWLHYILRKSITALRYRNANTKTHRRFIVSLENYEANILRFNSVCEFVDECL